MSPSVTQLYLHRLNHKKKARTKSKHREGSCLHFPSWIVELFCYGRENIQKYHDGVRSNQISRVGKKDTRKC